MLDIQAVYVHDIAELRGIRFITMIRIEAHPAAEYGAGSASGYHHISEITFASVTGVRVHGSEAQFMLGGPTTLFVAVPEALAEQGIPIEGITDIRIIRADTDSEGLAVETVEELTDLGGPGGTIDIKAGVGSRRVTIDGGILSLTGKQFDKAVAVRVNEQNQEFVIINPGMIFCTLPAQAKSIETVDVITTSKTINRNSLFAYLLTDNVNAVQAEVKLVQQFVKVLLTSPGSDVFDKSLGGNLQNWVGHNVPLSNPHTIVAKTVLNIVTIGFKFAARQGVAKIPPEERLSDVEVLNVGFDPTNPSVLELSIKLNTFAKRQANISLLIGTAQDTIQGMVNEAPTF